MNGAGGVMLSTRPDRGSSWTTRSVYGGLVSSWIAAASATRPNGSVPTLRAGPAGGQRPPPTRGGPPPHRPLLHRRRAPVGRHGLKTRDVITVLGDETPGGLMGETAAGGAVQAPNHQHLARARASAASVADCPPPPTGRYTANTGHGRTPHMKKDSAWHSARAGTPLS